MGAMALEDCFSTGSRQRDRHRLGRRWARVGEKENRCPGTCRCPRRKEEELLRRSQASLGARCIG